MFKPFSQPNILSLSLCLSMVASFATPFAALADSYQDIANSSLVEGEVQDVDKNDVDRRKSAEEQVPHKGGTKSEAFQNDVSEKDSAKKSTMMQDVVEEKHDAKKELDKVLPKRDQEPITPVSECKGFVLTTPAERGEVSAFRKHKLTGTPKLGLALGGGGARGAAEVGALKVLEAEGIKFDYVTGTSVGAVVGGFHCMGATAEQLEEMFIQGNVMRKFMTVPITLRIAAAPLMLLPRVFGSKEYDGLYKGNLFRKFLVKNMREQEQRIEDLKIPFAALALNLLDGKPYMLRAGNLGYVMQASCAVPSLRKPVEIEGQLFCDGGTVCNLPVKQCRELGADVIIAINVDEPFVPLPLSHFRKMGSVTKRYIDWSLYEIDEAQSAMADITIHPDTSEISLISTKRKDAVRALKSGEEEARRMLPQIRRLLTEKGIPIYGVTK